MLILEPVTFSSAVPKWKLQPFCGMFWKTRAFDRCAAVSKSVSTFSHRICRWFEARMSFTFWKRRAYVSDDLSGKKLNKKNFTVNGIHLTKQLGWGLEGPITRDDLWICQLRCLLVAKINILLSSPSSDCKNTSFWIVLTKRCIISTSRNSLLFTVQNQP